MGQLGQLYLKANDKTDIFLVADVFANESYPSDETLMGISTDELDSSPEWISGRIQKKIPVDVDGDTAVIECIYKATEKADFELTVYLEYEEVEEVVIDRVIVNDNDV